MAKILFNELVKETQKRLIDEALQESFNNKNLGIELKIKGIQVYKDLFSNDFPLNEIGVEDEDLHNYHYVYAETDRGTFQLLWDADEHCFDANFTLYKKKKGIELPPVKAPEPVVKKAEKAEKKVVKKSNKTKEEKKDGKVQENEGNAEAKVS